MRRERGAATFFLFTGLGLFVCWNATHLPMIAGFCISSLMLALFTIRDDRRHFIDIRHQRELIAQAQGFIGTRK